MQEHGLAADGAVEPAPAVCAAAPLGLVGAEEEAAWGRIIFAHAQAQVEGEAGEVEGLRQARAARVDVVVEAGAVVEEPARSAATRVAEPPAPAGGLVEEQELIAADLPQPEAEPHRAGET